MLIDEKMSYYIVNSDIVKSSLSGNKKVTYCN